MRRPLLKASSLLNVRIDETILPYIVQDISHLIGLAAALKLVEHYKGTRMWVPREYHPDLLLVKIIGPEATIQLIAKYGNESWDMPKCEAALRVVRNGLICASEQSQSQLAREYDLTVRQIRNIQNGGDGLDDKQERLF